MSAAAIAEPADVVDPAGRHHRLTLTPAGHVALFARALHAAQAREVRRRTGARALVECCSVERGADGRPRPRRSGHPANFPACGNVPALQALAAQARQAGCESWCSPLARTAAVPGGRTVPGGRLVWADADTPDAVARARALARTVPVRLAVESGGAGDERERRLHLYLLADRWLDPDELEGANAALAARLGSDRVGDRGRLMRLPGTRNLKGGRPGRWCRILSGDLRAAGVDPCRIVADRPLRAPARMPARGNGTRPLGGAFDALAPRDWFAALEPDRPITRYGYARCPLHDEDIPSLKLYDAPQDGWYCWGCGRGGDLIEYAAWRWHGRPARELSGEAFRALTGELAVRVGAVSVAGAAVSA
jgi:CHC2 zinc finger